jgi:hypothetical protein
VIGFLSKRVPDVVSVLVNSEVRENGKREIETSAIVSFAKQLLTSGVSLHEKQTTSTVRVHGGRQPVLMTQLSITLIIFSTKYC